MKKIILSLFTVLSLCVFTNAQSTATNQPTVTAETKTKKPIFRANKAQIMQAQKMLNATETGKMSKEDRLALKTYQTTNGLKANGSLNRATLEKMGIELTDKQKEIPVTPNSFTLTSDSTAKEKSADGKPGKAVFRASKEQIMQTQKMLKTAETGKLSEEDRVAIKAYQTANGIKPTGGLNKVTLEKMGITLTDKQKQM